MRLCQAAIFGLTPRSSGAPTASQSARFQVVRIVLPAGGCRLGEREPGHRMIAAIQASGSPGR